MGMVIGKPLSDTTTFQAANIWRKLVLSRIQPLVNIIPKNSSLVMCTIVVVRNFFRRGSKEFVFFPKSHASQWYCSRMHHKRFCSRKLFYFFRWKWSYYGFFSSLMHSAANRNIFLGNGSRRVRRI